LVTAVQPLVIDDARGHPLVSEHPVLKDLDVAAYAGVPLVLETGHVLGSFCVIDTVRREWTSSEIAVLTDLAKLAVTEAEFRLVAAEAEQARAEAGLAIARERTARAAAEVAQSVAEEASRAKTHFLTTMSHELRTPLNAIGGHAQLIEMGIHGPVSVEQLEALSRIRTSGAHLLGLINDVLNMTRLGARKVRYTGRPAPLAVLLDEVEGMVAPQMTTRGLVYEQEECDPALVATADPEKVRQVLINLLTHAMKFTERGGRVGVQCGETRDAGTSWTWIRVSDTGIGIEADKLAAIFKPFVQVDTRLSRTNEGVGLGLAISRELARLMGGDLTVQSEFAQGSAFTLTLPCAH
jgi:signal transduction histidine kinase